MQPINYNIDVKSPLESTVQGYQIGSAITAQEQQQQALQLKQRQELQMQTDLANLANNKNATAQDYVTVMTRYPSLAEHLKKPFDILNADQQQNKLSSAVQVYSALQSGNPDAAAQLLTDQATALRNSGREQDAKAFEALTHTIQNDPSPNKGLAKTATGLFLSSVMGPEKFATTFSTLEDQQRAKEKAPVELREAEAKAKTAEVQAKYADSSAILDLQKKGWDITKIQEDIKIAKETNRIAAMKAAADREGNALKRDELKLKIAEAKEKREEAIRAKTAEVESSRSTIDNFLNTADKIINTPSDVVGSAAGPVSSRIPTSRQSTADFEALVETLGSQAFLSQIPSMKGTGNLSEKEGDKLQAALANLSLKQSPEQLIANVKEAQRLMMKARKNLTVKYGVPETIPDTPAAKPAEGKSTDDILRELGVM